MDKDISSMMENLKSMLNNNEMPPNIKEMLESFMKNSNSSVEKNNDPSNIDINTIIKMQQIIKTMNNEESNSRSNLLRSLKPYLKPSRQKKIDQYIQLLNIEKVLELLNKNEDK